MKQTIITAMLAFGCLTGQAKVFKTIKAPESMASVNVNYGELIAREVIMTDTATTVHFTIDYPKGQNFRFDKGSYLIDENKNRYPLRSAEGLKLNSWVTSPESGKLDFTMHFEPMPKKVKIFDFIEGDAEGAFMLLGIHDKKTKLKTPTLQELSKNNPWTVPADWFKTDTITIKGRIEGYDAKQFGFTSMQSYQKDVFSKEGGVIVLDIAPDGTFQKKFLASYPTHETFHADNSKVGFREIPFFARPGETIDITVKKSEDGQLECIYNNGSSKEVERLLKSKLSLSDLTDPLTLFKGKFSEANQKAEEVWKNLMYRIGTVSKHDGFTPMEVQLALADAQALYAVAYMDYAMYREYELEKQEVRDGVYYSEIIDSTEWEALRDYKNYIALHHVDLDNPLLFQNSRYYFTFNRIQFARPVSSRKYKNLSNNSEVIINEPSVENEKMKLANLQIALRDLMGTDKDNLMSQLCIYGEILSNFNQWRDDEEEIPSILADTTMTAEERQEVLNNITALSNVYPIYLEALTHPYFRQKAEQFYAYKMAQKELSTPLPEDNPAADLIRSLSAKYPGRFLIIDFWGMGCGPCRSAIQSSKEKRAEIAKMNDVKLIFIAGERTAEGSDAYHKYVNEWLADEEAVCVTNEDFRRLEEMFQFSGIPHYETITPDCRRVRDDLRLNGFHNFDNEIKILKEKLK